MSCDVWSCGTITFGNNKGFLRYMQNRVKKRQKTVSTRNAITSKPMMIFGSNLIQKIENKQTDREKNRQRALRPGWARKAHHRYRLYDHEEIFFVPRAIPKKSSVFEILRWLEVPYNCERKYPTASLLRVTRKYSHWLMSMVYVVSQLFLCHRHELYEALLLEEFG